MPTFKVNVKWGKEKYSDLDLSTEESPDVFKLQLYSLTNVLPERQKVMLKGVTIKDDWANLKFKNGTSLLLMGTAEELPSAPVEKTLFIEDMTEDQLTAAMELVTGLENLGNTCYMNATVQLLKSVPEMDVALQNFTSIRRLQTQPSQPPTDDVVTLAFSDLIKQLKSNNQVAIKPYAFLSLVFHRFPHFAEKDEHGRPMQQDANEFLTAMLRICQTKLKSPVTVAPSDPTNSGKNNFIDQYFGIEYDIKYKCMDEEAKEEAETRSNESSLQLNCFISQDVKYMLTGIKTRLDEEITKRSPTLGRDAKYKKTSQIKRLPAYLCVQMVRFYYKEKGQVNAKILKDVKFPMQFDAFDLCSPELQKKLQPVRDVFEADEEALAEAQLAGRQEGGMRQKNQSTHVKSKQDKEWEPFDFSDDIGSNNSGHYELTGIITHQGRSSSSGHYVAWIRKSGDDWLKCDDDNVSPVTSEEVLKLSGGGDWHIAYVLLYGPRRLEKKERHSAVTSVSDSSSTPMETEAGS